MRRLRVFRWSDSLIPGFLFISYIVVSVLPKNMIESFLEDIGPSKITALILIGGFTAYILGTVTWGIAYIIRSGSIISITIKYIESTLDNIFNNISIGEFTQENEEVDRTKYRRRRLEIANRILREIETERDRYVGYDLPQTFENYHEFRLAVFNTVEKLPESIGARIQNQWEYLGLLQTLFTVSLLFEFVFIILSILSGTGMISLESIILNTSTSFSISTISNLIVLFSIAMVYSHRNDIFARDVAYAFSILCETIDNKTQG